jgi:hypothetical protein
MQYSFFYWVHLQLEYGFSFFGVVDVVFHEADPEGWWIRGVAAAGKDLPEEVAATVRELIEFDKKTRMEITYKCVRKREKFNAKQ